jgi:hypothetical protein
LSSSIRAVIAMERESRAVAPMATKNITAPQLKSTPTPMPKPMPSYASTPPAPAASGGGDRVSDLFADVVPVGYTPPAAKEAPPTQYGNIGAITSPQSTPAPSAADDELDR